MDQKSVAPRRTGLVNPGGSLIGYSVLEASLPDVGVAGTTGGGVGQIRTLACDCTLTRIVFGPDGQPVDIGRATTRVVPPALRRAVIARDRHCQHSGCDRPARWSDIHHIVHWADGGVTAIWNLILLCRFHHTWEHRNTKAHSP